MWLQKTPDACSTIQTVGQTEPSADGWCRDGHMDDICGLKGMDIKKHALNVHVLLEQTRGVQHAPALLCATSISEVF